MEATRRKRDMRDIQGITAIPAGYVDEEVRKKLRVGSNSNTRQKKQNNVGGKSEHYDEPGYKFKKVLVNGQWVRPAHFYEEEDSDIICVEHLAALPRMLVSGYRTVRQNDISIERVIEKFKPCNAPLAVSLAR